MLSSPNTAAAVKAETMNRVFFENVRCFSSRQVVHLAPLTILVGENSSGKSTALALVRLAWDLTATLGATPLFNEEPFLLGAYGQIASGGDKRGSFVLGLEVMQSENQVTTVSGRFEARRGQPALAELTCDLPPYHLSAFFEKEGQIAKLLVKTPLGQRQAEWLSTERSTDLVNALMLLGRFSRSEDVEVTGDLRVREDLPSFLSRLTGILGQMNTRPYAFAPMRTRPLRTYDPSGLESPEGSHVPMLLASTILREPEEWQDLINALGSFGQHSGLFRQVEVRRLGPSESDPFQIRVHVGGNAMNLIDVGYGVSQVLPIIVDSLRGKQGGTFLLQQPEVHLHPKAQAELGSFFGALAKRQDKYFVVETHSDYLVDRIRMDIRDKKNGLRPEDVSLLYFERNNGEAQIHRLELDEHGNIVNAPPGYRNFFLEEERRFLGG